jgi:hypothetical protein
MPVLTLFTAPKAFSNPHIATIQRNAIANWLQLGPDVDVMVVGQEAGLAEAVVELGAQHLPEVARNAEGTPLISSIFHLARQASHSPLLAYLNADILVLPDFVSIARQVHAQVNRFLIVGQRWDLDVTSRLDFSAGWGERLWQDVRQFGALHRPAGSDYFIFPRELFSDMPGFAVGRAGWDNWMIYHARRQGWPVIDGTPMLRVIHQNHDYSHLPGGQPHYNLEETRRNMEMAGGQEAMYTVLDTDRQLINGVIHLPRPTLLRLLRQAELILAPTGQVVGGLRRYGARQFRRLRRRLTGSL